MEFDKFISKVPIVDEQINYWLIRTSAGKYYDLFFNNNRIAIGEDYIDPEKVLNFPKKREEFFKSILPVIEEKTEGERPSLTANQFYRLYHEIKKGDIILIPSASSTYLKIGKIDDDIPSKFFFKDENGEIACPHIHTRNVRWITQAHRGEFNPSIVSLFFSHQAIVDANPYSDYINGIIYDFFIQDNTGHLILNVKAPDKIKARTLFYLFYQLLDLTEDFFDTNSNIIFQNDIDIRINLNSPGKVELISKNLKKLSLIGIVVVLVSGGSFKLGNLEIGTDGLLKPILAYINEQDERKVRVELIKDALEELNVKEPQEIAKIINEARIKP